MKKRILALALFSAVTVAQAATVEPYGTVGVGFFYTHQAGNYENFTHSQAKSSWGLSSFADRASRLGLKGSEKVGQGLEVGFQLESSLNMTTGEVGLEEKRGSRSFFDRQSRLYVKSDRYGELGVGRFGGLTSLLGPYAVMGQIASPFFGDAANMNGTVDSTISNTVAYQSPKLMGLQVTGMYSYAPYSFLEEGKQRYMGMAVTYNLANVNVGLSYEKSRLEHGLNPSRVMVAGNVAMDSMVLYGSMRYSRHGMIFQSDSQTYVPGINRFKSYNYQIGLKKPMSLGDFKAYLGYDLNTGEYMRVSRLATLGGSYSYRLSKHTNASMGLDFAYGRIVGPREHYFISNVNVGVTHSF